MPKPALVLIDQDTYEEALEALGPLVRQLGPIVGGRWWGINIYYQPKLTLAWAFYVRNPPNSPEPMISTVYFQSGVHAFKTERYGQITQYVQDHFPHAGYDRYVQLEVEGQWTHMLTTPPKPQKNGV